MLKTYATAQAVAPRMPEPDQEGTPPDVYVLGTYCKMRLRGVGNVMKTAPKKKAIY